VIIVIKVLEIGPVTPPLDLNVAVIKTALGSVISLQELFRGISWFIAIDVVALAVIVAFPALSLWLPSMMQ